MDLYLFGHRRMVGKDTTANFIKNNSRRKVYIYHLADAVKDASYYHFSHLGLKESSYYNKNYKEKDVALESGISPRDIWIIIGNSFREIDPDIWVKYVEDNYLNKHINEDCVVLIPDLRFSNEFFENYNAKKVKIIRPNIEQYNDPSDSALENFNEWDYVINNDGNLLDLEEKVKKVFCGLLS